MLYQVQLVPYFDQDSGWDFLENHGLSVRYAHQDEEKLYFVVESLPPSIEEVVSSFPYQEKAIDWEQQWQIAGLEIFDGKITLLVGNESLFLYPGPGFGDSSHPTTALILHMMVPHVLQRRVLDIGCGSAILTLAALKLGASYAQGIEIDADSLEHAKKNAKLNGLKASFCLSAEERADGIQCDLLLINMIFSEQREALKHELPLYPHLKECFTSGILKEEKEEYLHYCEKLGWQPLFIEEREGWLGFHFIKDLT